MTMPGQKNLPKSAFGPRTGTVDKTPVSRLQCPVVRRCCLATERTILDASSETLIPGYR